jgi:Phage tail assembly chaperone proteins, E, or 41 or 14
LLFEEKAKMDQLIAEQMPESAAAAIRVEDGVTTVELQKPIAVFGDKVASLKFRRPTAAELVTARHNPVIFDTVSDPPLIRHDYLHVMDWIALLTKQPRSSLLTMDVVDLVSCAWAMTPFFMPNLGAPKSTAA